MSYFIVYSNNSECAKQWTGLIRPAEMEKAAGCPKPRAYINNRNLDVFIVDPKKYFRIVFLLPQAQEMLSAGLRIDPLKNRD